LVLPDSPVYQAREVVNEAVLSGVENQSELAKEKIEQLSDKVAAAEEVTNIGEPEVAKVVMDDSKEEIKDVQTLVDSIVEESAGDNDELIGDVDKLQNYISTVSREADIQVQENVESGEDIIDMVFDSENVPTAVSGAIPEQKRYGVTVNEDKQLPPGLGE